MTAEDGGKEGGSSQLWIPIESNPEIMSKFLYGCGMPQTWAVTDVYSLDEGLLQALPQPVVAIMMLFPMSEKVHDFYKTRVIEPETLDGGQSSVYFMKQTIGNACGTVAMIHSIANNLDTIHLEDGVLKTFLSETSSGTPEERAGKLEDNASVCNIHDEVAREGQTAPPEPDESVDYHFVAFVEKDGHLYELDGRRSGPYRCGPTTKDTFLQDAAKECQKFLDADSENVRFSILALAKADS